MKIKKAKLQWGALNLDYNGNIRIINVLSNELKDEIAKKVKKKEITNLRQLRETIKLDLIYHYWSRAEWEFTVCGLHDKTTEKAVKVDVYAQLEPNLDRITEYVNNEMELMLE